MDTRKLLAFAVIGSWCLGVFSPVTVSAEERVLFFEDFEGYSFSPLHPVDSGLPLVSEGARETWYGGRFESFDNGSIDQDLAVQKSGGILSANPTQVAHFEDDAGLLFKLSTLGLTDVKLSFDYRTFLTVDCSDRLVAGYFVGELGFGDSLYRDFFTDDFGADQAAAEKWWQTEWTEIVRDHNSCWQSVTDYSLPENQETVWVAFWLDNGENDFGKIDNIRVMGTQVIPEPIGAVLFLLGTGALALRRIRINGYGIAFS